MLGPRGYPIIEPGRRDGDGLEVHDERATEAINRGSGAFEQRFLELETCRSRSLRVDDRPPDIAAPPG
jgi:hypothetical protein